MTRAPISAGLPPSVDVVLLQAMDAFDETLKRVELDQWDNESPCEHWKVRDVVGHVVGTLRKVNLILHGEAPPPAPSDPGDVAAHDPVGVFQTIAATVRQGVEEHAGDLSREIELPTGRRSLAQAMEFPAADVIVHCWDIASATNQTWVLTEEFTSHIVATLEPFPAAALRGPGRLGLPRPVGDNADDTTQLMAWLGRDTERWTTIA